MTTHIDRTWNFKVATMQKYYALLLAGGLALSSSTILADTVDLSTYNCGNHHIEIGMSATAIKQRCQVEPSHTTRHERPALKKSKTETQPQSDIFEKLLYSDNIQGTTHVLIKNDKVIRIFTYSTKTASGK